MGKLGVDLGEVTASFNVKISPQPNMYYLHSNVTPAALSIFPTLYDFFLFAGLPTRCESGQFKHNIDV